MDLLLVDDDLDAPELLAELLELRGHRVRIAHDGQEALRLLRDHLPDVAVLDVEMPVMDGPDLSFRMLVTDCGMELVPVVLVSGVEDLAAVARRVGTPYFVAKPASLERLLAVVERAVTEGVAPVPPE